MSAHFFELYDLPISFHPDQDEVRRKFLEVSRQNHPDISVGSKKIEASAENNQAYKTLKNKYLRVRYVLKLLGLGIEETDTLPNDFLMDMMEWNERIEDASHADVEQKKELRQEFTSFKNDVESTLDELTQAYDEIKDEATLIRVKEICLKQKYLLRLNESIDNFAGI